LPDGVDEEMAFAAIYRQVRESATRDSGRRTFAKVGFAVAIVLCE
jgi:hypothetical protein